VTPAGAVGQRQQKHHHACARQWGVCAETYSRRRCSAEAARASSYEQRTATVCQRRFSVTEPRLACGSSGVHTSWGTNNNGRSSGAQHCHSTAATAATEGKQHKQVTDEDVLGAWFVDTPPGATRRFRSAPRRRCCSPIIVVACCGARAGRKKQASVSRISQPTPTHGGPL
jgi:hypothetical protein